MVTRLVCIHVDGLDVWMILRLDDIHVDSLDVWMMWRLDDIHVDGLDVWMMWRLDGILYMLMVWMYEWCGDWKVYSYMSMVSHMSSTVHTVLSLLYSVHTLCIYMYNHRTSVLEYLATACGLEMEEYKSRLIFAAPMTCLQNSSSV